jgi:hypothetical protein
MAKAKTAPLGVTIRQGRTLLETIKPQTHD